MQKKEDHNVEQKKLELRKVQNEAENNGKMKDITFLMQEYKFINYYFLPLNNNCQIVSYSENLIEIRTHKKTPVGAVVQFWTFPPKFTFEPA